MKLQFVILAVMVGLILVIAGTFLGTSEKHHNNSIRVAYFPNIGHAIPIVGIEQGIFEESLGNQTRLESKLFDSGPQVIEALFAKSIDIAYVGPVPAINGFLKSDNDKILIISGAASGGASVVVHPNSKITLASDFAKKRIAAPQIGNTQDVSLRNYLLEHGLKPVEKGGNVRVFNIPNPEIYTLFAKGDIDAAWVPEPWATILVQDLGGQRLFYEEDLWDNKQFASVVLIGRAEYVKNNPEIIQHWLDSHEKTANWVNANQKETTDIFDDFMKKTMGRSYPKDVIAEALSNLKITSDPIEKSIFIFAQRADGLGYLGRDGYNIEGIFYQTANIQEMMK